MRFLFITAFTAICNLLVAQTQFVRHTGGHSFSMEIPDYFEKRYDLNDAAYLQYGSTEKESYIIVIPEEKAALEYFEIEIPDAESYLESFASNYKLEAIKREISSVAKEKIGDLNFAQAKLSWEEDGYTFEMLMTAVESPTYFYNILCWTSKNFAAEVWDDFLKSVKSFKE